MVSGRLLKFNLKFFAFHFKELAWKGILELWSVLYRLEFTK